MFTFITELVVLVAIAFLKICFADFQFRNFIPLLEIHARLCRKMYRNKILLITFLIIVSQSKKFFHLVIVRVYIYEYIMIQTINLVVQKQCVITLSYFATLRHPRYPIHLTYFIRKLQTKHLFSEAFFVCGKISLPLSQNVVCIMCTDE